MTPKVRLYVTNSAGNTVDVINPATNKTVQTIDGIELPHGVVFSPDGSRVYISNESESVLDVVQGSTGRIVEKVPLGGHPNNLTITKDGKRVLVGIRENSGWLEVIDAASLKKIKNIPVSGPVHNVYVTPDGKYAVAGSIDAKNLTVVDLQTEQAVWNLNLGSGVRPMAFEANPDGSTKRIFAQLSGFNGFAVVDFAKHLEVQRIKLPDQPGGYGINGHAFPRHRCGSGQQVAMDSQHHGQRAFSVRAAFSQSPRLCGTAACLPAGSET